MKDFILNWNTDFLPEHKKALSIEDNSFFYATNFLPRIIL